MGIGINMSFCEYAELRDNKWYCFGTREIDPCPCDGKVFSKKCYYSKEREKTMRKHPVDTINLEIVEFHPFYHSEENNGFVIEWESDIGFGQYTIYKTPEGFVADSEHMDSNEDKDFIKELMRLFIEKLRIDY